jgi:plastocyanin
MAIAAAFVTLVAACGSSSGSDERQVLVDYSPDDVAVFVAKNFPGKVKIAAGQTIAFKQTWTGEPHTVTGGKLISESLREATHWFALFDGYTALVGDNPNMVNPEEPGDATFADFATQLKAAKPAKKSGEVVAAWRTLQKEFPELPNIDTPPDTRFDEVNQLIDKLSEDSVSSLLHAQDDNDSINQGVAHPCYLASGSLPLDGTQACSASQQRQPAFDGTHSIYNSGVLPYSGPRGNTFRMTIAKTTKPGAYFFYCAVHGPDQRVEIDVVKPGTSVPSASAVAREGRREAEETVQAAVDVFRDATKDNTIRYHGRKMTGPFAGLPLDMHGSVNEFVPRTLTAKVGEPITWKIVGSHTISFDVPAYLPILQFGKTIRYNPKVRDVAGGVSEVPDQEGEGVVKFDAGTYDGTGFWSSGLTGADPYLEYTLRITKPGTYPYACLVHPKMIGKVVVS